MSLLFPAARNLSQLTIDGDKDWAGFHIANLGAPTGLTDALRQRLALADVPRMTLGYLMVGQGGGVSPTEMVLPSGFYQIQKPAIVRYVCPGWYSHGIYGAACALTNGRIYYCPIFVTETTTYSHIAVYVRTGAAGTGDLRIFEWANGLPAALRLSCGNVDSAVAGLKEIAIAHQMPRGYYFLALRFNAAIDMRAMDGQSAVRVPVPGCYTTAIALPSPIHMYVDAAYADPAPAPAGIINPIYGAPIIMLREN